MSEDSPLSEMMNAMVSRLEYTQPEEMRDVPEDKHWDLIRVYASIDPVLAMLYKQYCEAKENLGKLLLKNDTQDPLTEIAWDMRDSLHSAVETRLLELKDDKDTTQRVMAIQSNRLAAKINQKTRSKPQPDQSLNEMMAFMLWAGMVMKNMPPPNYDIRRDFVRAS